MRSDWHSRRGRVGRHAWIEVGPSCYPQSAGGKSKPQRLGTAGSNPGILNSLPHTHHGKEFGKDIPIKSLPDGRPVKRRKRIGSSQFFGCFREFNRQRMLEGGLPEAAQRPRRASASTLAAGRRSRAVRSPAYYFQLAGAMRSPNGGTRLSCPIIRTG